MNVIQSRHCCVLLDTSVFHWLPAITFMYCIATDDVPVAP